MEGLAKLENVTPDLQACDMETHQSNAKMAVLGQNHPLMGNIQNSSIKVQ